jgi:serine O-acetyltransferase
MRKFSEDIARYRAKGNSGKELWLNAAVWAIAAYRLANWLNTSPPNAIVRIPLKLVSFAATKWCEIFLEMHLNPGATIGGGLYISHNGGVHINPLAVIGKNCDIAHHVTIGASGMGRKGVPILGDEVYVGTGATLVGRIRIGSGAKIAANTLVISNVPERATVMGVPGRVFPAAPRPVEDVAAVVAETTDASG